MTLKKILLTSIRDFDDMVLRHEVCIVILLSKIHISDIGMFRYRINYDDFNFSAPDLNPIEHFWDILGCCVPHHLLPPIDGTGTLESIAC